MVRMEAQSSGLKVSELLETGHRYYSSHPIPFPDWNCLKYVYTVLGAGHDRLGDVTAAS